MQSRSRSQSRRLGHLEEMSRRLWRLQQAGELCDVQIELDDLSEHPCHSGVCV